MRRLNILLISLYLPLRNIHGGGNRLFQIVRYLSSRYNVHIISFLREWEEPGLESLSSICKDVNIVKIREENKRSYSLFSPGFLENYYYKEMRELIYRTTKKVRFDIIQFEYLPMAQYRDDLHAKTILTEHQLGFLSLKREMGVERDFFKKALLYFRAKRLFNYEMSTLNMFDRVIFINKKEAEVFKNLRSVAIPMGVDTEYFKPTSYVPDTDLIYIGNFDNYQNVDSMSYFLKDIWPLIKKARPGTNFKIVGFNARERLTFLEDIEGIEVIGYVKDIRDYLNTARLFVMPARIGSGMRGKLLEAVSMRIPVISTSLGLNGYEGDILKTVMVADEPIDFSHRILELLNDKGRRLELGYRGREIVERGYTWDIVLSEMDSLYEELYRES